MFLYFVRFLIQLFDFLLLSFASSLSSLDTRLLLVLWLQIIFSQTVACFFHPLHRLFFLDEFHFINFSFYGYAFELFTKLKVLNNRSYCFSVSFSYYLFKSMIYVGWIFFYKVWDLGSSSVFCRWMSNKQHSSIICWKSWNQEEGKMPQNWQIHVTHSFNKHPSCAKYRECLEL